MYEVLKAKYVYTWEVVGDTTASSRDCFRGFNPTTHKAYEEEVQNWSSALLAMASEVADSELPAAPAAAAPPLVPVQKTTPLFDPAHPDANPGPRSNAEIGRHGRRHLARAARA